MLLRFTNADNEEEVYLNPDYIMKVNPLKDANGREYSRIHLEGSQHYEFIDVDDPIDVVWEKVRNNEQYQAKYLIGSELGALKGAINSVCVELRYLRRK